MLQQTIQQGWYLEMSKLHNLKQSQSGVVLVTIILLGMILTFVGMSLAEVAVKHYRRTTDKVFDANATLVAEAGIERSVYALNQDNAFTGYDTEQEFFNNSTQGRGTYQTEVTTGDGNEKLIISTGRVYGIGGRSDEIVSTRKIRVSLVGTTSAGYSVYTGPGGLILGGSANITNSEIYVNGYIDISGSAQVGTNTKPLSVNVANRRCPLGATPGPTYPMVCAGSGKDPIIFTGTNAQIYGSVCATGQTDSTGISGGSTGAGLIPGCITPANITQPPYDRTAHIDKMVPLSGYASTNSTYACSGSQKKTWPANLRLNGDVTIGSSCKITLSGDVYVTGDFTLKGSAQLIAANDLTEPPVIVVDGKIDIGGSGGLIANNLGVGLRFISFKSAAACEASCSSLSGNDLYNSQNLETINVNGNANLAGMIFQAYWGKATISGSGNIGSVIGQTVDLSGSGTIVFGLSLSSGVSTWTIRSYQQIFD